MSLDLNESLETSVTIEEFDSCPKYCDFCKFLLVEELCLEDDYRLLHHGKCTVIGKVLKTLEGYVYLENVQATNLPNECSLPEGTLKIRLLTFSYFGTQLQNNKSVEVCGEVVLYNTKHHLDNHYTYLTSKGIAEKTILTKSVQEFDECLKYFHNNYKPAITVWLVQQIDRAGDLIQRNLELRMLQE